MVLNSPPGIVPVPPTIETVNASGSFPSQVLNSENMSVKDFGSGELPTKLNNEAITRVSVHERLSDANGNPLDFGNVKILQKPKDFASIVSGNSSKPTSDLDFFPLADKKDNRVHLLRELAQSTIYGYFLGPRIHFTVVQRFIKNAWGKYGLNDVIMNGRGFFFFKFNDLGGSTQVMENGPWMVNGVPLFVYHWDPMKGLVKPEHTTCPLWVKMHNVPLVVFNKEGISQLASAVGEPMMMDAATLSMCEKSWGRPGFARVLINVWAVGDLKRELEVSIPNIRGGDDYLVKVGIEHTWEPNQCSHCMVFGHKRGSCVKAVVHENKIVNEVKNKEGRQHV